MRVLYAAAVGAVILSIAACDATGPDTADAVLADARGGQARVDVCHSTGSGYSPITVSARAVDAHRRHGDALPGEDVPGQSGFAFDDACVPTRAVVAALVCPAELAVGEEGTFTGSVNPDAGGLGDGSIAYAFDLDGDATDDAAGTLSGPDATSPFTYGAAGTYTASFTVSGPVNTDTATCTVEVTASETVFARAYVDIDPADGDRFVEGTDILIAKLVDTNRDGTLTPGDEVITNQYPTTARGQVGASEAEDFTTTRHVVTSAIIFTGTVIRVQTGRPSPATLFDFQKQPEFQGGELYWERVLVGPPGSTFFRDSAINEVVVNTGSPSRPRVIVSEQTAPTQGGRGDQGFLDVDISTTGL